MADRIGDSFARSNLYKLLSFLFLKEPDEKFLAEFKNTRIQEALSGFGFEIDVFSEHNGGVTEDLAVEYTALFIGPIERLAPYESAYREGTLYGNSALDVLKFYERSGFSISPDFKDLPDHIGVELELMHHLALKEARYTEKGNSEEAMKSIELQREFMDEHLIKWVPGFCKKVEEFSKHPFYALIARLTQEFIKSEHEALRGGSIY
jgi:DMSO reductase family type II enzyme chaperone